MNKQDETLTKQAEVKRSHLEHVSVVVKLFAQISEELSNLKLKTSETEIIQTKLVINRIYTANIELVESMVANLLDKNYTSVEILSRVISEYSVNIIYILEDDSTKRTKSLLKNYLNYHTKKIRNWNNSHRRNKIECNTSEVLAKRAPDMENIWTSLLQLRAVSNWPNARKRFLICGFEEEYITIYGSASEAVHSLSEDIFNYVATHLDVGGDFDIRQKFVELERISFSIYLALCSLRLFLFSFMSIADKKEKNYESIENVFREIEKLIALHNNEIEEYYSEN